MTSRLFKNSADRCWFFCATGLSVVKLVIIGGAVDAASAVVAEGPSSISARYRSCFSQYTSAKSKHNKFIY